jgi:hypothetical protein
VPDAVGVLEGRTLPLAVVVPWAERELKPERELLGLPVGVREGPRERVGDELAVEVFDGLTLRDIVGLPLAVFEILGDPVVVFEALKVLVELVLPVCVRLDTIVLVAAGLELAVLEGAPLFVAASVYAAVFVGQILCVGGRVGRELKERIELRVDVLEAVALLVIIAPTLASIRVSCAEAKARLRRSHLILP